MPEPTTRPAPPERTLRASFAATRRAQKSSRGGPAYSAFVNRPLGRVLAALAHVAGRTPNQVTAISAVCTFSGIGLIALARPTVAVALGACALLVVGYALDSADGQLARLRGGGSAAGEWLDHVVDAVKAGSLHAAVLVSWYRFSDVPEALLLVPLGFQIVSSSMFFVIMLNDRLRRAHQQTTDVLLEGSSPLAYRLAVLPTDYGFLCLSFALFFWHEGFRWIYSGFAAANALFFAAALVKWFREMRSYA